MKKYKPSKLGLNPEWFITYLITPFYIALITILFIILANYQINKYISLKKEKEYIEESKKLIQESILESESYEKYLQESIKIEKEEAIKKEKEAAAEQQHINTEYQNKIFSEYWKKGTYVYDIENERYGVVNSCQIPHVITKEGWYFIADESNGYKNYNIQQVGWLDWKRWTEKQLIKKGKEISKKMESVLKEEYNKREAEALKKFPKNPKYGYCKYDNDYYFIISWKNGTLKLRHKDEPVRYSKYIFVEYDDPKISELKSGEIKKFYAKN